MKKNKIFLLIGVLSLIISAAMYAVGSNSSHLSELKDFFYIPIPLGIVFIALGLKT